MALEVGTDCYCERTAVQALHQHRTFSATTKPTATEVDTFITDGFHEINGVLSAVGYSTPVSASATKSISILARMNAAYAGAAVERAVFSAGLGGNVPYADSLEKFYADRVKMLEKGTLELEDATTTNDLIKRANVRNPKGEFNLDTDGDEQDPVFARDTKF